MTIVFNLLYKVFIAILDILLLDFYLKNIYPDIYNTKLKKINRYVYLFLIVCSLFMKKSLDIVFIDILLIFLFFITLKFYRITTFSFVTKLICYFLLKHLLELLFLIFFSFIFDNNLLIKYINYSTPYILLSQSISRYFTYTMLLFIFKINKNINIKRFKKLSILVFTYFSLTFILNNNVLFRTPTIARTYIFTVVISIIALICFDRMQTKYEKDKHLQESIIQNLEKEKEFNQQREQQQKEIRKINHNLNNILIILQSHLEKEEYEEAKDYIEQNLKTHVEAYQALTHTGIAAIDGALNAHIQSIKEKGIQYDENISKILHLGSIVPGDLALIISLALDNAKEACENIDGEKHISLKLQSKQTHVILYIENSIPEGSHPSFHKTSKKDKIAHGFGVSSIKEMAERYHGEAKYEVKHDQVILRVVLQK